MSDTPNEIKPLIDHTQSVRDWLAAPAHERGYYWTRIDTAWRQARAEGTSDYAAGSATALLRANGKLKGYP